MNLIRNRVVSSRKILASFLKSISYLVVVAVIVTALLELIYRYQLIEFYNPELRGLNPRLSQELPKGNVLVFGDSFSAHPESWVKYLREAYPQYNFINASVPGSGILQHELFFRKRLREFMPVAIIYQFYNGNDFLDIRHPVNFKTLSLSRNLYWILSEKLLISQYINKRLANLKPHTQTIMELHDVSYSKFKYNKRTVKYFTGDPWYLSGSIMLADNKTDIYKQWRDKFVALQHEVPDSVPVYLLVIPHCAQVHDVYQSRMKELGGYFDPDIMAQDYPLIKQLGLDLKHVGIIDPLPFFQELESEGIQLYYSNDPHLNNTGQKYLGKYMVTGLNL
jgi:hypothetical protein